MPQALTGTADYPRQSPLIAEAAVRVQYFRNIEAAHLARHHAAQGSRGCLVPSANVEALPKIEALLSAVEADVGSELTIV